MRCSWSRQKIFIGDLKVPASFWASFREARKKKLCQSSNRNFFLAHKHFFQEIQVMVVSGRRSKKNVFKNTQVSLLTAHACRTCIFHHWISVQMIAHNAQNIFCQKNCALSIAFYMKKIRKLQGVSLRHRGRSKMTPHLTYFDPFGDVVSTGDYLWSWLFLNIKSFNLFQAICFWWPLELRKAAFVHGFRKHLIKHGWWRHSYFLSSLPSPNELKILHRKFDRPSSITHTRC